MSRGRFFGMLISNLEEFFGSHPPGGVNGGGRGGFLFFNQYHLVICLEVGFFGMLISNLEEFLGSHPPGGVHGGGRGGGKRRIFIFQPISSCDMSRGRFFGMLISNLEEFFGSHPPGGVHGEGEGGGKEGFLFFNQYHHMRCLEVGILGY